MWVTAIFADITEIECINESILTLWRDKPTTSGLTNVIHHMTERTPKWSRADQNKFRIRPFQF